MMVVGTAMLDAQINTNGQGENNNITIQNNLNNNQGYFIENKGQWNDNVLFMAQANSLRTWVTKESLVFEQFESIDELTRHNSKRRGNAVAMKFINSNQPSVEAIQENEIIHNFLVGDISNHATDVKSYKEVLLKNIFDQIDLRVYYDKNEVRYDFIVHPYANPNAIKMEYLGAENVRTNNKELTIETGINPIIKRDLYAWQDVSVGSIMEREEIALDFKLEGNIQSFEIGNYDNTKKLIIDPMVQLIEREISDPVGNPSAINDIYINGGGEAFICGYATSITFPITLGTYFGGSADIVIGKLSTSLNVHWLTFFGGTAYDNAEEIFVSENDIYFTGVTESHDFPLVNPLDTNRFTRNNYFAKISIYGTLIRLSTFLGNFAEESYHSGLKVSENESMVYIVGVAGKNQSPNFYQKNEILTQTHNLYAKQGFIIGLMKVDSANYLYEFSSLFGGQGNTDITAIDLDESNNIYITGVTESDQWSFYCTSNAYDVTNILGNHKNYTTKLAYTGNLNIIYNTFFADLNGDTHEGSKKVLFADSCISIAGSINKNGLPLKNSFDSTYSTGGSEAFIAILKPNGNGVNDLVYSSYFGGTANSEIWDLDYDEQCEALLFSGFTGSELTNYNNTLLEQWPGSMMVGTVNYKYGIGNGTLHELAYLTNNTNSVGYALDRDINNFIRVGGSNSNPNSNMFINIVSKQICYEPAPCNCPISSDYWIDVETSKAEFGCDSLECFVSHTLNIPSSHYDCYEFITIEAFLDSATVVPATNKLPLSSFDFADFNFCIPEGSLYEIIVKLYKDEFDFNPCLIRKYAYCPLYPPEITELCLPDCEGDDWSINYDSETVELGNCCFVHFSYTKRNACNNGWFDIVVNSFEKVNLSDDYCCYLYDDEYIYNKGMNQIIDKERHNAIHFQDNIDSCTSLWRVSQSNCWASWKESRIFDTHKHREYSIHKPCVDNCCLIRLEICPNEDVNKVIDYGNETTNSGNLYTIWVLSTVTLGVCDSGSTYQQPFYPFGEYDCEFTCDLLENIDYVLPKRTIMELLDTDNSSSSELQSKEKSFLIRDDYLTINDEYLKDDVSASIYDINGALMFKDQLGGFRSNKINISYLRNGTYLVVFSDNENILSYFKILINR